MVLFTNSHSILCLWFSSIVFLISNAGVPCFHLIRWRSVVYNTNEPHASCIYSILNAADFRESFDFNLHGKLIDKKNFRFLRRVCQEPSLFSVKRKDKNLSSWAFVFFVISTEYRLQPELDVETEKKNVCTIENISMLKSITPSPCYIVCLVSLILPCYNYDTCLSRVNMKRKLAHVTFTEIAGMYSKQYCVQLLELVCDQTAHLL